jgi:hypothetical protein
VKEFREEFPESDERCVLERLPEEQGESRRHGPVAYAAFLVVKLSWRTLAEKVQAC